MRLNAKTAKEMRREAKYRNQTATPSHPKFPGVARLYSAPVYMTRTALESTYEARDGKMVRVFHKKTKMAAIARHGKEPTIPFEMERYIEPAELKDEATGETRRNPKAGLATMRPRLEMIPVTKRVTVEGPKKTYRLLKRLHGLGQLEAAAAALYDAALPQHLRRGAA